MTKNMNTAFAELRDAQEALKSAEGEIRRRLNNSFTIIWDVKKKEARRGNVTPHSFFDWTNGYHKGDITITEDERFPVKVNGHSIPRVFVYGSTWEVAKFTRDILRLAQMKDDEVEVQRLRIRVATAEERLDGQKAELRKKYEKEVRGLEAEHERAHAQAKENLVAINSHLEKLRAVVPTS